MKVKYLSLIMILVFTISATACQDSTAPDKTSEPEKAVEATEDSTKDDKDLADDTDEKVAPEFDANGNPTGDYAQYLWDQQRKEEAMKSIAEDAIREEMIQDEMELHLNEPW